MVVLNPPVCDFGRKTAAFYLRATDGRCHPPLDSVRGYRELLVPSIGRSIKWRE